AALLTYFGQVQRDVTVEPAIVFTGESQTAITVNGGETVFSKDLLVESKTSVLVPLSIDTTHSPNNGGITHTVNYLLSSTGSVGDSNENRIFIRAEDTLVTTLSDLTSISWDVDGTGYIAHVDVFLDNGEVLVFEYAKVKTPFDEKPYPEGSLNTFGIRGIVDNAAGAWISSGCAGEPYMVWYTLSDWKSGKTGTITKCDGTSDKTYNIIGSTGVIGFEIETDNWIIDSESEVSNILINGNPVEVSLKPSDSLEFNVETEFSTLNVGTYTVTTTVEPRA
ncbi:hypothetical protein LCGC14_3042720, partial [marine sediment metagenome]